MWQYLDIVVLVCGASRSFYLTSLGSHVHFVTYIIETINKQVVQHFVSFFNSSMAAQGLKSGLSTASHFFRRMIPSAIAKATDIARFIKENKDVVKHFGQTIAPVMEGARDAANLGRELADTARDVKSLLTEQAPHITPDEILLTSIGAQEVVDELKNVLPTSPHDDILLDDIEMDSLERAGAIHLKNFNDDITRRVLRSGAIPLALTTKPTKLFISPDGMVGGMSTGSARRIGANYLANCMHYHPGTRVAVNSAIHNGDKKALGDIFNKLLFEELEGGSLASRELMRCILYCAMQARGGLGPVVPLLTALGTESVLPVVRTFTHTRGGIFPLIPLLAGIGTALSAAGAGAGLIAKVRGGSVTPRDIVRLVCDTYPEGGVVHVRSSSIPMHDETTHDEYNVRGGIFPILPLLAALLGVAGGAASLGKGIHQNVIAGRGGSIHFDPHDSFLTDSICDLMFNSPLPGHSADSLKTEKMLHLCRKEVARRHTLPIDMVENHDLQSYIIDSNYINDDMKDRLLASLA